LLLLAAASLFIFGLAGIAQARSYSLEEQRFLTLINQYRAGRGLAALQVSDNLSAAAAHHSQDMGKYTFFDHATVRSDVFAAGSSPWDRMRASGYRYETAMAENIAAGQATAQEVFDGWKSSPGHNANMLSSAYRVIGIGFRSVPGSPYGYYWTTDFGGVVDPSAHPGFGAPIVPANIYPFADVDRSDAELYAAACYVKDEGIFEGYANGYLGPWDPMTHRQVALILERTGKTAPGSWLGDYGPASRGEVMDAFPGLEWNDPQRRDEPIVRSQLVRLIYRAQ